MIHGNHSFFLKWVDYLTPDHITPSEDYNLFIRTQFTLILAGVGLLTNLVPIYIEGQELGWLSPISFANYALGISALAAIVIVWKFAQVSLAAFIFLMTAIGAIMVTACYSGGLNSAVVAWFGLAPLAIALLANIRSTLGLTALIICGIGFLTYLHESAYIFPDTNPILLEPSYKAIHLLSVLFCGAILGVLHIHIRHHSKTKIKETQRELEEQRGKLFHSQKLNLLGEMAGGIAHEINNPLTIIQGLSDKMKVLRSKNNLDDATFEDTLQTLDRTVQRVFTIVKGLQGISRDGSVDDMVEMPVLEIVNSTLNICGEKLKANQVDVTVSVPEDLNLVCQAVQVSQVILNLINNAADALQESAGTTDQQSHWLKIEARRTSAAIEVSVTDSGPGIPQALRDKVMNPFFTTKEIGKGTGLGLSISSAIMAAHGGRLVLDENCAHTRFVMVFPVD